VTIIFVSHDHHSLDIEFGAELANLAKSRSSPASFGGSIHCDFSGGM
jgi:hypothetical protein